MKRILMVVAVACMAACIAAGCRTTGSCCGMCKKEAPAVCAKCKCAKDSCKCPAQPQSAPEAK